MRNLWLLRVVLFHFGAQCGASRFGICARMASLRSSWLMDDGGLMRWWPATSLEAPGTIWATWNLLWDHFIQVVLSPLTVHSNCCWCSIPGYSIRVIKQSVNARCCARSCRGVRCTELSQVARATPEVPAGKRLRAHLFIHVSPERGMATQQGLKENTTQFKKSYC